MINKGWRRVARILAIPALVVAAVVVTPLAGSATPRLAAVGWTPMTPVSVNFQQISHSDTTTGTLLAFNDFHGNIDPPTGSGGLVNGVPSAAPSTWPTTSRSCGPRPRPPRTR